MSIIYENNSDNINNSLINNLIVEDKPEQQQPTKTRKKSVITSNPDVIDKKLENYLSDIYANERISQIPFRKISAGYYDYGTTKVMVKLEGELIKSKHFNLHFF